MQGASPVSFAHTAAGQPVEIVKAWWSFQAASCRKGTLNMAVFQLAFGVYLHLEIPIPNQSAIFVGSSSTPQRTNLYASVAEILAALISSLI
jgi:hypothetical protein